MKNKHSFKKFSIGFSLLLCSGMAVSADIPAGAQIATLSQTDGIILVNQGKFAITARAGQKLNAGDRILSMSDANATVTYNDGCVLELKQNSRLILKSAAECSEKTASVASVGPHFAAVGGAILGSAVGTGAAAGATAVVSGVTWTWMATVAVVGGGVGAWQIIENDKCVSNC